MSENETPTNQHPAVRKSNSDMTVTDYRLQAVENAVHGLTKSITKLIEKSNADEVETKIAIERCSTHGFRLEVVEKELKDKGRDPVTFWTAISGAAAAAGAWMAHFWSKGG